MRELVEVAKAVLGKDPGAALLLFVLVGILAWVCWKQQQKIDAIRAEQLKDSREDAKEMTGAVIEAKNTMQGFKATLDAIATSLQRR
jgi:hypothetical protein